MNQIQLYHILLSNIKGNMQYIKYAIKFDVTSANPKRFTWTEHKVWWITSEPTVHYDDIRFARLFDSEYSANLELRKSRFRIYGTIVPVTCTV